MDKKKLGKRILVLGCAGSGKSTLSKRLSAILGIEVIHLDAYYWKDWKEADSDEFAAFVQKTAAKESWIIDGNYRKTLPVRLAAADSVIFLDFPTSTCIMSVIKRTLKNYGKEREDMGKGCHERFDLSFLRWVLTFRRKNRRFITENLDNFPDVNKIVLKSRKQANEFLNELF